MNSRNLTADDIATIERIAKHGELQAMDRVEIVGLTSGKGLDLNGRTGTVRAISGTNDGRVNPYVARLPDGRYKIDVEYEETKGREVKPGSYSPSKEIKTFSLKRENLVMLDVGKINY